MYFEIIGDIKEIEVIAKGLSVRERGRLVSQFGKGRWRKLKGIATIRVQTGPRSGRRYTGMRPMALGGGSLRSSGFWSEP